MRAHLLLTAKNVADDGSITQIIVWELPAALEPCTHRYKYRLYYGADGVSRVRYDNELGKGDHRHVGGRQQPYSFTTVEQLLIDFERDCEQWSEP